jgi:hypothetical protein
MKARVLIRLSKDFNNAEVEYSEECTAGDRATKTELLKELALAEAIDLMVKVSKQSDTMKDKLKADKIANIVSKSKEVAKKVVETVPKEVSNVVKEQAQIGESKPSVPIGESKPELQAIKDKLKQYMR